MLGLIATLTACGGGGGGGGGSFPVLPVTVTPAPEAPPATYTVGGTVSGLIGSGLVLQNNGGDDLAVAADGTFSFPKQITKGAGYAVTVKSQSKILTRVCTVSAGTGTVSDAAVSNVAVKCAEPPARFAYVPSQALNTLSGFTIDAVSGALTSMAAPAMGAGTTPVFTAVHPSGRFAYLLNIGSSTISNYTIDTTNGLLNHMAVPTVNTSPILLRLQ
jgi:6-phosphogluconolactonase